MECNIYAQNYVKRAIQFQQTFYLRFIDDAKMFDNICLIFFGGISTSINAKI